jgi:hypothetical protein
VAAKGCVARRAVGQGVCCTRVLCRLCTPVARYQSPSDRSRDVFQPEPTFALTTYSSSTRTAISPRGLRWRTTCFLSRTSVPCMQSFEEFEMLPPAASAHGHASEPQMPAIHIAVHSDPSAKLLELRTLSTPGFWDSERQMPGPALLLRDEDTPYKGLAWTHALLFSRVGATSTETSTVR